MCGRYIIIQFFLFKNIVSSFHAGNDVDCPTFSPKLERAKCRKSYSGWTLRRLHAQVYILKVYSSHLGVFADVHDVLLHATVASRLKVF